MKKKKHVELISKKCKECGKAFSCFRRKYREKDFCSSLCKMRRWHREHPRIHFEALAEANKALKHVR